MEKKGEIRGAKRKRCAKDVKQKKRREKKEACQQNPRGAWGRGDSAWEVPLQSDWVVVTELRGWGQGG